MAEPVRSGTPGSRANAEDMRRFVAKLEAFAAGLSDVEREMLRVALGINVLPAEGEVRGYGE